MMKFLLKKKRKVRINNLRRLLLIFLAFALQFHIPSYVVRTDYSALSTLQLRRNKQAMKMCEILCGEKCAQNISVGCVLRTFLCMTIFPERLHRYNHECKRVLPQV